MPNSAASLLSQHLHSNSSKTNSHNNETNKNFKTTSSSTTSGGNQKGTFVIPIKNPDLVPATPSKNKQTTSPGLSVSSSGRRKSLSGIRLQCLMCFLIVLLTALTIFAMVQHSKLSKTAEEARSSLEIAKSQREKRNELHANQAREMAAVGGGDQNSEMTNNANSLTDLFANFENKIRKPFRDLSLNKDSKLNNFKTILKDRLERIKQVYILQNEHQKSIDDGVVEVVNRKDGNSNNNQQKSKRDALFDDLILEIKNDRSNLDKTLNDKGFREELQPDEQQLLNHFDSEEAKILRGNLWDLAERRAVLSGANFQGLRDKIRKQRHVEKQFEEAKLGGALHIPLPEMPTQEENMAELARLRSLRRALESGRMNLRNKKTIFKDPIPKQRMWKRRPLLKLPLLNCTTRHRLPLLPQFTRKSKLSKPRIAIVSLAAKSRKIGADNVTRRSIMHDYTFLNKLQYCKKLGYDFILEGEDVVDRDRPPHWSKIRVLRKWLPFYDWVVWMDMDTLFVDWSYKIEDLVVDEVNRFLLEDLKRQEKMQQDEITAKFIRKHGGPAVYERLRKTHYIQTGELLQPPQLNDTDPLPKFRKRPIDLILTHDQNGINSGVFFLRNTAWSANFLRRMWGVPKHLCHPFHDQGAMRYLITPNFRNRNEKEGEIDKNHVWDTTDNVFNSYPENFIREERDMPYRYQDGDWIVHLASCKYYSYCLEWVKHFYEKSICNNTHAFDPPANFTPPMSYFPPDETSHLATLPPIDEEVWDVSGELKKASVRRNNIYLDKDEIKARRVEEEKNKYQRVLDKIQLQKKENALGILPHHRKSLRMTEENENENNVLNSNNLKNSNTLSNNKEKEKEKGPKIRFVDDKPAGPDHGVSLPPDMVAAIQESDTRRHRHESDEEKHEHKKKKQDDQYMAGGIEGDEANEKKAKKNENENDDDDDNDDEKIQEKKDVHNHKVIHFDAHEKNRPVSPVEVIHEQQRKLKEREEKQKKMAEEARKKKLASSALVKKKVPKPIKRKEQVENDNGDE